MSGYFEPLQDPDSQDQAPVIIPLKANPWAAGIDHVQPASPEVQNHLAYGQNLTTTADYMAANPPPYLARGGNW